MRVLVTGAAGFAARHLVPELAAHGHMVTASDVVDTPRGEAAAVQRAPPAAIRRGHDRGKKVHAEFRGDPPRQTLA